MAMQEGRRSRGEEEEEDAVTTFVWSELPKEVQHKVLSCLPIQELCQARCVCKDWRDAIHRREFRAMYDAVNSQSPSPVICYMESSYPVRLEWSAYDYAARTWKRMNSFPSLPQSILTQLNVRRHCSLSSVGGLLCLYFWKQQRAPRGNVHLAPPGVSSWTVWHPFRNRWKRLPACKHREPVFVHAFVSDAQAKTYKLLVAHNPKSHRNYFDEDEGPNPVLVTEVYDYATGAWSDGAEHTLRSAHGFQVGLIKRGVLAHGAVYFLNWEYTGENALLSYDIKANQWHEESFATRYPIFEWDGRLMSITSRNSEADELDRVVRSYWFVERDPGTRRWEDTGIEIPWSKILSKFRDVGSLTIVASGNHLALTGCAADGGFKIAVYKRAENYWRLPPTGAFSDKMERSRVEGVVLYTPQLDWRP
jgi:hypothetical protein